MIDNRHPGFRGVRQGPISSVLRSQDYYWWRNTTPDGNTLSRSVGFRGNSQ